MRRCHGEIDGDLNDERLRCVVVLWCCVELSMGLREILQCLEKAPPTVPISAFTIKNLLRHYAKQAFKHSK